MFKFKKVIVEKSNHKLGFKPGIAHGSNWSNIELLGRPELSLQRYDSVDFVPSKKTLFSHSRHYYYDTMTQDGYDMRKACDMCGMTKDWKILAFLELVFESQNHREKLILWG
jgi:hypothetical protein